MQLLMTPFEAVKQSTTVALGEVLLLPRPVFTHISAFQHPRFSEALQLLGFTSVLHLSTRCPLTTPSCCLVGYRNSEATCYLMASRLATMKTEVSVHLSFL